jgi:large subunit ribosomal protein L3
MAIGLLGKKIGMTRVYQDGKAIPVTVIHAADNTVLQVKTQESDNYSAVQVGYDDQKEHRVKGPMIGHFAKTGSTPKRFIREIRLPEDQEITNDDLKVSQFEEGQMVDVIGKTKGKGFQGVVKRHGFGGSPMTHGSMMHRRPGAIAQGATPARVWKNQKMPGQTGNTSITVQNLKVVKVDEEDGVILISGAVPGPNGNYVFVRPAIKTRRAEESE